MQSHALETMSLITMIKFVHEKRQNLSLPLYEYTHENVCLKNVFIWESFSG